MSEFEFSDEDVVDATNLAIVPLDVSTQVTIYRHMVDFINQVMRPGIDYGVIPGTAKPVLMKPGAEKFLRFFGYKTETKLSHSVEGWNTLITVDSFPLFHYRYTTTVYGSDNRIIANSDGETNSYETKYRYHKVLEHQLPSKWREAYKAGQLDVVEGKEWKFAFAIDKKETTGQYAEKPEYWASWEEDIAEGRAVKTQKSTRAGDMKDAWERSTTMVRIPNESIFDQVNTIMKMAQKRSFVGAIIIAANASEFFTQDLEDYAKALDPEISIRTFVPTDDAAKRRLIEYVSKRGKDAMWIKNLFTEKQIEWDLSAWQLILDEIEEELNK